MANGRKHVTLRSPAVLFNDSTVPLEASVVPRALRDADDEENDTAAPQGSKGDREISGPLEVEEEIFENERLIPCVGWSNAFLPVRAPMDLNTSWMESARDSFFSTLRQG